MLSITTAPAPALFFFFNDTATTEIYTLSLHDALPIPDLRRRRPLHPARRLHARQGRRSEEHTSELQSLTNLVCRLLLEKKKNMRKLGSIGASPLQPLINNQTEHPE